MPRTSAERPPSAWVRAAQGEFPGFRRPGAALYRKVQYGPDYVRGAVAGYFNGVIPGVARRAAVKNDYGPVYQGAAVLYRKKFCGGMGGFARDGRKKGGGGREGRRAGNAYDRQRACAGRSGLCGYRVVRFRQFHRGYLIRIPRTEFPFAVLRARFARDTPLRIWRA